jgi:hypothetical protein
MILKLVRNPPNWSCGLRISTQRMRARDRPERYRAALADAIPTLAHHTGTTGPPRDAGLALNPIMQVAAPSPRGSA